MWTASNVYLMDDCVRIRRMKWHDLEQIQEKMAELSDEDKFVLRRGDPQRAEEIDYYIRKVERMHVIERLGEIMGCFSACALSGCRTFAEAFCPYSAGFDVVRN